MRLDGLAEEWELMLLLFWRFFLFKKMFQMLFGLLQLFFHSFMPVGQPRIRSDKAAFKKSLLISRCVFVAIPLLVVVAVGTPFLTLDAQFSPSTNLVSAPTNRFNKTEPACKVCGRTLRSL